MVTRLNDKTLKRSVGGLILTLDETHLTVHRTRHKHAVQVAFSEMVAAADQVRPPRGWVPQVGDTVAVLPARHRAQVLAVVPCVPELLVTVRYPKGTERTVELSQLVPVDNSRVLVECERICLWT